ncbi:hypothetical protein EJ08DRAFT_660892 [Tothia fuscella]|uniref:Myb-like DNA-binding domain-containing protein n=1 Tax=Tothia fuscella TaxID=1048955 RepID=A0A9P4NRP9_9PEZI|nr:hypothetical protein EJ08DRAFT_660892 [Tothia fuscella]
MAPTSSEETVKFLIACIKNTESRKVDFQKVADQLDIVSKAAAAKRYERILKASEKTASEPTDHADAPATTPKSTKKGTKKSNPAATPKSAKSAKSTPASKKRKITEQSDNEEVMGTSRESTDDAIKMEHEEAPTKSIFGGGEEQEI